MTRPDRRQARTPDGDKVRGSLRDRDQAPTESPSPPFPIVDQASEHPPHVTVSDPGVVAWLNADPTYVDAVFVADFWRAVADGDDLDGFDPKRVARLASDLTMRVLDNLPDRTRDLYAGYVQRVKAARLRAVCPSCGQVKPR